MISAPSTDFYTITIILLTTLWLLKKYIAGGVCKITKDLTGQVVIITGSNTGIGKEAAHVLAKMNATIIMACRDFKRTLPVVQEIKSKTNNQNVEFMQLDLADLKSIKLFAENFKKKYQTLNILINNAGVLIQYKKTTADGFEAHFGTNHLGHFYLTNLLTDVLEKSAPSRVVTVSSMVHANCNGINWEDVMYEKSYNALAVYPQSKLANMMFTKELNKRLEKKGVKAVCLHPGVVWTEVARHIAENPILKVLIRILMPVLLYGFKSPFQGAQTTVYCALEDHEKLKGGMYYSDCKLKKEGVVALEESTWKKLWDLSEDIIRKALEKTQ